MNGRDQARDDGTLAALLRLTDLAAKVEQVEHSGTARAQELARDCAAAQEQITGLRGELGTIGGRADAIDRHLTEVSGLLAHMSEQVAALTARASQPKEDSGPAYQVNPAPPWWKPGDERCQDAVTRLADWVDEVYRPVFGYLGGLLAPCWPQHPLCLVYLDALHEAWCLLYLPERDPKMVFAQLDWLTRSLLQAAEVISNETRACRDHGSHRTPSQVGVPAPFTPQSAIRR